MSKKGIELASQVFSFMQINRHQLLTLGSENPSTKECKQDILLAKLFEKANDLIKDDFMKVVGNNYLADLGEE